MPKIIIHAAEGTFAPAARAALVTELTDFALDCEGLPTSRFMIADLAAMRASPPDKPAP